jgi:hypothetical protein
MESSHRGAGSSMPKETAQKRQYLVWIDILGFVQLCEAIAQKKEEKDSGTVRERFKSVIRRKVDAFEKDGLIIWKEEVGDRWLMLTGSLKNVFLITFEVYNNDTGWQDYPRIPLEIAIGTGDYSSLEELKRSDPNTKLTTLKFLLDPIAEYYRDWHKKHNNGQSIKSTFIVLTDSAHQDLRPLDKKMCERIRHEYKKDGKKKVSEFSAADVDKFSLRGKGLRFA